MNEEPSPAEETEDEPSVFGNLPRSRPGARSPRRDAAAAKAGGRTSRPADETSAAADGPVKEARADEPPPPPPESEPSEHESERGGVEELAWAGVAAAAEAATLGVRLANRALDSLRGGSGKP